MKAPTRRKLFQANVEVALQNFAKDNEGVPVSETTLDQASLIHRKVSLEALIAIFNAHAD